MKWENKGLCSTFFVSSLGSCLWQKSLGPFLADPVVFFWEQLSLLWAEERREAGEKGLFVGPTGSCQRGLAPSSWCPYVPTRPSWTETYQAACVEPEKGLGFGFGWTLDLVYCAGTTPSSKTGTLWGVSQESRCCSCPGAWGHGRSAPTRPGLAIAPASCLQQLGKWGIIFSSPWMALVTSIHEKGRLGLTRAEVHEIMLQIWAAKHPRDL